MEFNKPHDIIGLKVLTDNVIWLWKKNKSVVVIDPAIHEPVINYLDENNLNLKVILQTHHHSDHIGGTKALIEKYPNVKVIASIKEKDRIPFQNLSVKDGDKINILDKEVQIIEINHRPNFKHPLNVREICDVDFIRDMSILFANDSLEHTKLVEI